jgi:hypothetical protein
MGAIAAAALLRKERHIVAAFAAAGATSPANGRTAQALGIHEGLALRKLQRRAVLREAGNGGLYLDEPAWDALQALRRRLALVLIGIVVVGGTLGVFLSSK